MFVARERRRDAGLGWFFDKLAMGCGCVRAVALTGQPDSLEKSSWASGLGLGLRDAYQDKVIKRYKTFFIPDII